MTGPVLVYDDACGFCTWWADWVGAHAAIRVVGFSALTPEHRNRLPEHYERCVHLLADGRVYSCGEAVEAALVRLDFVPSMLRDPGSIRRSPHYRRLREHGYRWVANNRDTLSKIVAKTPRAHESDSGDST
ncbi:MAG: DCC1-like thiol-disulfide oxidoreductase family protein [Halodesulfurarchaeum sp.]|nr:DCC1-like thiol-disulfide oxidoreductase family protein [Halodesulfurarchaeum sp.]